jgi:hypothetical protein
MSVALNKEKNKSNRHITLSENQICKALEEPINSLIYLGMRRISIGLRGTGVREEMLGVNHKLGYMPAL